MKGSHERRLMWAIVVTLIVLVGELVGGLVSNSLALLSDAGHVLTDVFALGLSLIAVSSGRRPSDYRATYGYQRIGILAALINGSTLVVISVFIFLETYRRFFSSSRINTGVMLFVAGGGLLRKHHHGAHTRQRPHGSQHKERVASRARRLITSAGVIIAGLLIRFTGWHLADPIASGLVGVIIILGGGRVIKEALWVFLELSPLGLSCRRHLEDDLRHAERDSGCMTSTSGPSATAFPAFSAHVLLNDRRISETDVIRREIEERLADLGIRHTVLQMECAECQTNGLFCQIGGAEESYHHHH